MDTVYSKNANRDDEMAFSSDESDLEQDSDVVFQDISYKPKKLSLTNRSLTLTGIHNLPDEIMFAILKLINIKTLMGVVRFVSRYFYDFLSSPEFWELRLAGCLTSSDSVSCLKISDHELEQIHKIGLPKVVHEMESAKSLSYNESTVQYTMSSNHYGDVHCLKILSGPVKQIALSGSRDKTICVYDLKLLGSQENCVVNTNTDHNGWIWTIDQEDGNSSRIASGSWDSNIHFYDVGRGDLEKVTNYSVHSAILCTRFEKNFLLYGTYSKYVSGYDTRSGKVVLNLKYHTKPVLSITSSSNYIWSSGEDNALTCHDRRANKLLKRIRMERISSSIQFVEPYLWVAGYDGYIKCFNQDMKTINKFDTGHRQPIMDMSHNMGATVTACKDGVVKVFSPNVNPISWNSFTLDNTASCVDYKDGIVMAGCCDSTVTFWKNKNLEL